MAYFAIMNIGTERLHCKHGDYSESVYETERGAKVACTRLNKSYQGNPLNDVTNPQWAVVDYAAYRMREMKMVERTNLMSGKKYMEAKNTPLCCSPASETYWSI